MGKVIVMNGVIMEEADLIAASQAKNVAEIQRLNAAIAKHRNGTLDNPHCQFSIHDQTLWSAFEMGEFFSPEMGGLRKTPDWEQPGYDGPTETRVLNYWLKNRKEKGQCPCHGVTNAKDSKETKVADGENTTYIVWGMDSDGTDTAYCLICERVLSAK